MIITNISIAPLQIVLSSLQSSTYKIKKKYIELINENN